MNWSRSDLIEQLARHAGLTAEGARHAVDALFCTTGEPGLIATALRAGGRVQLAGFGTFEARLRRERQGSHPQTRAKITIPASLAPCFRAGASLKTHVR